MSRAFGWQQNFDGLQSPINPEEQQAVYERFGLCVRTILEPLVDVDYPLAEATEILKYTPEGGSASDCLRAVVDYNDKNPDQPQISIFQLLSRRPRLTKGSVYVAGADTIVRRIDHDANPGVAALQEQNIRSVILHMPEGLTGTEQTAYLAAAMQDQINQAEECRALEQSMGLNSQPVGLRELETLVGFLDAAVPIE